MIKSKKQSLIVIGVFTLVLMLGTVTYAFFNYTRTGTENVIKTGRISFNTSQSSGNSEAINLTNVFPISRSELGTDVNNSAEVEINIVGDTTYTNGLEYLVTFEDVNIETSTSKKIPIGIEVNPEKTGELGTVNTNYFNSVNDGGRGGNTSYYKVLANNVIHDGDYVLVGYIRPGVAEVNGTIGIKAFIDKDKILISDTYDGTESDNMGTERSKAQGKVVLTTEEWNSLQGNNSISFKIRIQANEGIWVGDPSSRNDMDKLNILFNETSSPYYNQQNSITEINFIRMSEEMIDTHINVVDMTATGGQGVVKAWVENNILYIASPGETYFPQDSTALLSWCTNLIKINFNNVNTSNVTNMTAMFYAPKLTSLDLSSFDTSNVTNMTSMFITDNLTSLDLSSLDTRNVTNMTNMFGGCTNLESVNLSGLGGDNLIAIMSMFSQCTSLKNINMSGFNFGTYSPSGLFADATSVEIINLKNANTSNLAGMIMMFWNCHNLKSVNLENIDTSKVKNMAAMFAGCTSLTTLDLSSFDTSRVTYMTNMFMMGTSVGAYPNATLTPDDNSLTKIYVGPNWTTENVTESTDMFYNNTHLVGGSGTIFDTNYIDKTYARVDGGVSNPGYLTLKTN